MNLQSDLYTNFSSFVFGFGFCEFIVSGKCSILNIP